MQKSCGNCKWWIKLGNMKGKGICDKYDYGWCPSDGGKDCVGWSKRPKSDGRIKGYDISMVVIDEYD